MFLDTTEAPTTFQGTSSTVFPWTTLDSSTFLIAEAREELVPRKGLWEIHFESETSQPTLESSYVDDSPGNVSWEWYPLEWKWWVIIQLLAAIVGIVGNLLVMLVVFRRGVRRRSTDILIGTLAVADFFTSVFLIPIPAIKQLPATWPGQLYCKIVYINFIMWTFVTMSLLILALVSFERFVAIAYPLRFKAFFSNHLTILYIGVITGVVLVVQVWWSFVAFVDVDAGSCVVRYSSQQLQADLGIALFFYKFLIPGSVMLGTQALTAMALQAEYRKFSETGKAVNACSPQFKLLIAKKRVVNMLLIVLMTFFICWGPNQIFYLLLNLGQIPPSLLYGPLHRFLVVLAFFNSCLNPVIYTARYPRFREALTDLFIGSSSSQSRVPVFGHKVETKPTETTAKSDVTSFNA